MKKNVTLNPGDYCEVNLENDENYIVLNGVIIHSQTIRNLSFIQHGFSFFNNEMNDKKGLFRNGGLDDFKKRYCDLYSWIIKSNFLVEGSAYEMPEKTDTILEFVQEQQNIMYDLSIPRWFNANGKHSEIKDKMLNNC